MSSRLLTKFLHSSSLVHSTLRFPIIFLSKIRLSENSEKDARFLLYEEEAASMPNPPSEIVLLQRKRDHMTPRNNSPSLHPGFAFIQPDTTKQYDHQVRKISSAESDLTLERMDFGGRSSTSSSDNNNNNNNARFDPRTLPTQRSKTSDEDWLELGLSSKSQSDLDIKRQKNPRIASPQQPTMRNEESYYYSKNTPVLPPPPSIPQFPPAMSNHWSYRENRAKSSIDPGGSRSSLPGDIQALSSMFTSFASQGRPVKNWADFRSGGETSNSFGVYEGFGSQYTENRHIFRPDIPPPPAPPPPAPQQNNNNSIFPSFLTEMRSTFPPLDTWRSNKEEALTSSWFRGNAADPAHILPTTTALKYDGGLEACSVEKRKKNSNITGWTEHTRIFKPSRRSQTGVWFTLQAVNDHDSRDRGLPQIPRNYLRIKDGNTTILTVKKYLVKKLGLHHESEVELSCKGQFLSPSLTLQHVHDVLWSSSFKDANIPIKFTNSSDNVNNSFDLMNHMMILNYHRGLTGNE